MSHETHETQHEHNKEKKASVISFKNSFWLVVIIVGLFIAALNFIRAESGEEEGGKEKVEMKSEAGGGEQAEMKADAPKPAEAAPADTAKSEGK